MKIVTLVNIFVSHNLLIQHTWRLFSPIRPIHDFLRPRQGVLCIVTSMSISHETDPSRQRVSWYLGRDGHFLMPQMFNICQGPIFVG